MIMVFNRITKPLENTVESHYNVLVNYVLSDIMLGPGKRYAWF